MHVIVNGITDMQLYSSILLAASIRRRHLNNDNKFSFLKIFDTIMITTIIKIFQPRNYILWQIEKKRKLGHFLCLYLIRFGLHCYSISTLQNAKRQTKKNPKLKVLISTRAWVYSLDRNSLDRSQKCYFTYAQNVNKGMKSSF